MRYGKLDDLRGVGYFVSFGRPGRHVLLAVRNRMRFALLRVAAKIDYRRLYIGPFEIEVARMRHNDQGNRTNPRSG